MLLNTSSYCSHSRLVFVSIFLPFFCSTPRVAVLVVDLSPSQFLPLWFAQHLELICSLLTCLDSRDSLFQPFVLCGETSTRSACCSAVSGGYLNTLTVVGLVLVSSCFIHQNISTFFSSLSMRFMSCCFLYFCYCFPQRLPVPNLRTPSQKEP